jgi:phosphohistidine phosphatase
MSTDRTILLLRHAKSAWGLDVDDHERPLSGRGRRDSTAVGELLAARRVVPDLVWCSTAVRARQTWQGAVEAGAAAGRLICHTELYEALAHELLRVLCRTPSEVRTVMLIGHAPAVPELVEQLAQRVGNEDLWRQLDTKFPTSGLATLGYRGTWPDLGQQSATLLDFAVPRGRS